jgi:hypothetical protein
MTEIKVEFPDKTISTMSSELPSFSTLQNAAASEKEQQLRELVNNAIRVYLQLKLIAGKKDSVIVETDGKKYIINLEE